MKKRSRVIASMLFALLIIGASGYLVWKNSFKLLWYSPFDNAVLKMAIYPMSTGSPSYYFILDKNSVLHCAIGLRESNTFSSTKFLASNEKPVNKKLTDKEIEIIMNLLGEIEANGNEYEVLKGWGSWTISLSYKDKIYETDHTMISNEKLADLSYIINGNAPIRAYFNEFS